jgi:hypothetical protein
MKIVNIKIKIIKDSKNLNSEDGGLFEKIDKKHYLLTIRGNYDIGRNLTHELGHFIHDYLYDNPGDESLPYALENATTLWWQEHHGEDSSIEFTEDKSVDESVDALIDE